MVYSIEVPISGQPISSSLYGEAVRLAILDLDSRVEAVESLIDQGPVEFTGGGNPTTVGTTYATGVAFSACTFVAPTSGQVWLGYSAELAANSTTLGHQARLAPYVKTGITIDSGSDVLVPVDSNSLVTSNFATTAGFRYQQSFLRILLASLTPGNPYNVRMRLKSNNAACTAAANMGRISIEPVIIS